MRRPLSEAVASSGIEERVVAAIDEAETLALLRDLIRCPSENPPGREEATARRLAAYFARHGVAHRLEEILPGRPNVIAEVGGAGGPALVLNGHLDTVPAGEGWTVDPFAAELRDGRVYGRGACDMLAGVAAMSAAAVALARSGVPLPGRVLVHAVIDEEVDSLGSRHAARDAEADWAIVTEPSDGTVQAYGKGQLNVEIEFAGRAAHSSRPELGHNAIHDAAAFIALVEREHRRIAADEYPGVGPATFTTALIAGGSTGSTVPARCRLTLDRRVRPDETLADAQAHVQRLLDRLAEERPGVRATLAPTLRFPPFPRAERGTLAATVQGAVRDAGAGAGELSGAVAATDAAWYAARGIPTVIYGPGRIQGAHEPDEFVRVEDLHAGTRALALAATRLLRAHRPAQGR
jgi:acetylornithine deacetylase/succinyl-diaminopimelate desuccinylase family protein